MIAGDRRYLVADPAPIFVTTVVSHVIACRSLVYGHFTVGALRDLITHVMLELGSRACDLASSFVVWIATLKACLETT